MSNRLPDPWIAHLRKEVQSLLSTLSPGELKALRTRFGLGTQRPDEDDDEESLRALARELRALKKKR